MPWLVGLLALAAVHFGLGLGDSSFFVDEIFSLDIAEQPLGTIDDGVRTTERIPPLHYYGLHEWMGRIGSATEAGSRSSSVIGGVLLVGAVYWMALVFVDRRSALVAAALCVASPLVLEYAQQTRAYVWVMLAVAVAVGATLRGGRWLWLGAAAAIAALWLHYLALLVVAPLCVWLVREHGRGAIAYVTVCALAQAALVPLMLEQFGEGAGTGGLAQGALSPSSVGRVLGTPFDGRWASGLDWPQALGAAATAIALVASWRRSRLLAALAAIPLLALTAAGVAGSDILLSRYATVAAPLLLVAIAAAPRPVLAGAAVAMAGGLVLSHGASGRYGPVREAITYVRAGYEPGDAISSDANPAVAVTVAHYAGRLLSPVPELLAEDAELRGRVWFVDETDEPGDPVRGAQPFLEPLRYRAEQGRCFTTSTTVCVVLAVPW